MYTPTEIKNTKNCQPHPWHPSVVYAEEGWCGHKFWMAQTPFPPTNVAPYRDRYELPCIHYSDDGKHWKPIPNNPIEELTPAEIKAHDYYSDPHLILKDGVLELYYRFTILKDRKIEGNKTLLYKCTSIDGYNWSERTLIADLRKEEDIAIWGDQIISQAIVWTGTEYRCWYVDRSSYLSNRKIRIATSTDGVHWTKSQECILEGIEIDPWHIDVQIEKDGYRMLVYDFAHESLTLMHTKDGYEWMFCADVLHPSHRQYDFFSNEIYRSCSIVCGREMYIYFSAHNGRRSSIGLIKTKDRLQFDIVNCQNTILYFLKTIDNIRFYRRLFNLCRRIFK